MHETVLIGQNLFDILLKLAYCVHEMSLHKFA